MTNSGSRPASALRELAEALLAKVGAPAEHAALVAQALVDADIEGLGSHGLMHRHLPELSPDELTEELVGSRERLAEVTGGPVDGLAYPYGDLGAREVEAARAAGYDHAVAVHVGDAGVPASRHAIPRSFAGQRDGGLRLLAKRARARLREVRAG